MKKNHFYIKTLLFSFLVFSIISTFSCDKNQSNIPSVYVDFYVDLNDPQHNSLTSPGAYEYVTGGVNGILVYHTIDDSYLAFERTCPYDPDCGKVYVDNSGFNAVDTVCCQSEFSLLTYGTPSESSLSQFPLKMYTCIYDINTNTLRIKN